MKRFLALLLIIVMSASLLFGCTNKDDEAPEGLQIGLENDAEGYVFYVPENWAIVNSGDVAAAKVSIVNNTSISFTEADMPECSIPEYFERSLGEFTENIKSTMKVTLRDSKCSFGNAKGEAYKYIYTYKYENRDYVCMQILLTNNESFYIFTYNSYGDPTDEESTYRQYLDSVQLAIDNFKFTDKKDAEKPVYEKDGDGYNLVSDQALAGFALYLPDDYQVIYSSGFVKAKISENANIVLSRATQTGVGILDYLKMRRDELSAFTTDFTDVSITLVKELDPNSESLKDWKFDVLPSADSEICFGNLDKNRIISYEYSYKFNGNSYHVYQIMGVDNQNGYVFTYTALENEFELHIDEIKTILAKVEF